MSTPSALLIRPVITCPVCLTVRCVTVEGRLWVHGPRAGRCPGSRLHPEAARDVAARAISWARPVHTVNPTGGVL